MSCDAVADEHGRETCSERVRAGREQEDLPQGRFCFFLLAARGDHDCDAASMSGALLVSLLSLLCQRAVSSKVSQRWRTMAKANDTEQWGSDASCHGAPMLPAALNTAGKARRACLLVSSSASCLLSPGSRTAARPPNSRVCASIVCHRIALEAKRLGSSYARDVRERSP